MFKSSKCSLCADDLKVHREIKSSLDCLAFQRDLRAMNSWCEDNSLELNIVSFFVSVIRYVSNIVLSDFHEKSKF